MIVEDAFKVWWDRWNGNRWCWRECANSPFHSTSEDVTGGQGYGSNRAARGAIRSELDRRSRPTA